VRWGKFSRKKEVLPVILNLPFFKKDKISNSNPHVTGFFGCKIIDIEGK